MTGTHSTFLAARLEEVRERVARAAERSGRDPSAVTLVAVTKTQPLSVIEALLEAGVSDIGENRVEQLVERAEAIGQIRPDFQVRWHMIGRLQRRQVPPLHGVAHRVHSVDSVRLAERLSRTRPEGMPPLPVLVQCNTSGEEVKAGFTPEEAEEGIGQILELPGLSVDGLMTMAPFTGEEPIIRGTFTALRRLHEGLRQSLPGYTGDILSMGMSNDFEWAVEEGSTMIRVGSVLFEHGEG